MNIYKEYLFSLVRGASREAKHPILNESCYGTIEITFH